MKIKSLLDYYKFSKKIMIFQPILATILFFVGLVKIYEALIPGIVFLCMGVWIALVYTLSILYINKKIKKLEAEELKKSQETTKTDNNQL